MRDGALCTCGHRYAVHAGLPESACVRYENGQRCSCREFVSDPHGHGLPPILTDDGDCAICADANQDPSR